MDVWDERGTMTFSSDFGFYFICRSRKANLIKHVLKDTRKLLKISAKKNDRICPECARMWHGDVGFWVKSEMKINLEFFFAVPTKFVTLSHWVALLVASKTFFHRLLTLFGHNGFFFGTLEKSPKPDELWTFSAGPNNFY